MKKAMYKVGICDDGKSTCAELEKKILRYAKAHNIKVDVQTWNSGEALCGFLAEKNELDLLFLDIELYEVSGIDVGHFIRENMENYSMQIVYISGKTTYAQSLFKVQPMDFLVKPIGEEQIYEALEKALLIIDRSRARFEYDLGKEHYFVPYREIKYLVSEKRKIRLVLMQGEREFYGKIADVMERMPTEFIMIHKSYIINKNYVARYRNDLVELEDGTELPISKAFRKQVRQNILREE